MIVKNQEIVLRKTGEFYFLIDPRKSYNEETEDIFQTDEMGAFFWNCIDNETEHALVLEKIFAGLNDEPTDQLKAQVASDLQEFIEILSKEEFLQET